MLKEYNSPKLEIVSLESDVIRTSDNVLQPLPFDFDGFGE